MDSTVVCIIRIFKIMDGVCVYMKCAGYGRTMIKYPANLTTSNATTGVRNIELWERVFVCRASCNILAMV